MLLTTDKVDSCTDDIGDHGSPIDTVGVPVVAISLGCVERFKVDLAFLDNVVVAKEDTGDTE